MSYNVKTITVFEKQAKRLIKKYVSLKQELLLLVQVLKEQPQQGTSIGKNCYKIRIAVASKGKGKSGGTRIITNIAITDNTVYLLAIYDKSEKDNLTNKELDELLATVSKN
jgi:mRNA-degrading endonuclease RelE of RelBE toxin-antitoxin system